MFTYAKHLDAYKKYQGAEGLNLTSTRVKNADLEIGGLSMYSFLSSWEKWLKNKKTKIPPTTQVKAKFETKDKMQFKDSLAIDIWDSTQSIQVQVKTIH